MAGTELSLLLRLLSDVGGMVSGLQKGEASSKSFVQTIEANQARIRKVALLTTAAFAGQVFAIKKLADAAAKETGSKEYAASMTALKTSVDGVKLALGTAFIPLLVDIADRLTPIVIDTKEWVQENEKLVRVLAIIGTGSTGFIALLTTAALTIPTIARGINLIRTHPLVALAALLVAGGATFLAWKLDGKEAADAVGDAMEETADRTEKSGERIKQVFTGIVSHGKKKATELTEDQKKAIERWINAVQGGVDVMGSAMASMLAAGQSVSQAFAKAWGLAMITIVRTFIESKIMEMIATKITEIGKAATMAPLSFGSTLLAIAPIVAAAGTAIGLLRALEGQYVKKNMPSFEVGGRIRKTGPAWMHEGEVVVNPRRPALGMQALAGAGGITFNYQHYGNISSDMDVRDVMKRLAGAVRDAMTTRT
jgi:hypothetical protein